MLSLEHRRRKAGRNGMRPHAGAGAGKGSTGPLWNGPSFVSLDVEVSVKFGILLLSWRSLTGGSSKYICNQYVGTRLLSLVEIFFWLKAGLFFPGVFKSEPLK